MCVGEVQIQIERERKRFFNQKLPNAGSFLISTNYYKRKQKKVKEFQDTSCQSTTILQRLMQ